MRETEGLNSSFEKLMVFGVAESGGVRITEWKDIPEELLLRILSLVVVDDQKRCKKSMNNLVLSVAPKFTKLQVLVLRLDAPQLQDDAVETIAAHCHELRELDLSKSFRLTDRSLYALSRGCPELEAEH